MRGVRAITFCLVASLALPGCMRTSGPVAETQPASHSDAAAYGRSYAMAPSPTRVAYAAPMPAAHDAAYRLDAGGTAVGPGDTVLVGERWF
jgi:polysaccharide biosynthesis/export protein